LFLDVANVVTVVVVVVVAKRDATVPEINIGKVRNNIGTPALPS
jgi:hypothetical protein